MTQYNVQQFGDYGYVLRAWIDGELVELARKDAPPPFAFVFADNLTQALAQARNLYGLNVIVSEQGRVHTQTRGAAVLTATTGAPQP